MGEGSKIEWTGKLLPKSFAALQFSLIANATWRVVFQLMTSVAKSGPVGNIKPEFRMLSKRLDVVGAEIATTIIPASLAGVIVLCKNSIAPILVLCFSTVAFVSLCMTIFVGVMIFTAGGAFTGDLPDFLTRFWRVFLSNSITWAVLSSLTHFLTRLFAHPLSFHGRDECLPPFLPRVSYFLLGFFTVRHDAIIPSNLARSYI